MSEPAPAFSFYAKDFMLGTVTMSLAERGAYITFLAYQWSLGSIPDDEMARVRILGCSRRDATAIWSVIRDKFGQDLEGNWRNARLERERSKQADRRAALIENGQRGGRPKINQTETNRLSKHKPNGNQKVPENETKQEPNANLTQSLSYAFPDLLSDKEHQKEARARAMVSPDAFTNPEITERAARFIERYAQFYEELRFGAHYAVKPIRDYAAAVTLCTTWVDDSRLDKLAKIFLKSDHKFAEEGSRTLPQFLALAGWCDSKLGEWEAGQNR